MFITLEGGEGSGKSTLLQALDAAFARAGWPHLVTREPGGTPLAERVRDLALAPREGAPLSPLAMALLMNAARADHLERLIRPALAGGRHVLCDRFADSTRVYQSVGAGLSQSTLRQLEASVLRPGEPDLTLILDADPGLLSARRAARGGPMDVFEEKGAGFHRAVREGFLQIAREEPGRCKVLDASCGPEAVFARAMDHIGSLVRERSA